MVICHEKSVYLLQMRRIKTVLKYLLAAGFVLAGANHFFSAEFYLRMMPPVLPAPLFLVYLSGVFEITLGILLFIQNFSRFAAWGIILLLIAVFPANIFMARHTGLFPEFSPAILYLRLPFQLILIAWAFWLTRFRSPDKI